MGGIGAVAATTGIVSIFVASDADTAQVDLNFENHSVGAPITSHAGARLGPAYAHSGSVGCRLDPTTTNGNLAYLALNHSDFMPGKRYATYSMFFRLVSAPRSADAYMNLFEIGTTSIGQTKSQFTVYFCNDRLVCDFHYTERVDIAAIPTVGVWHLIQVVVDFGATTYMAHIAYDGGDVKTLTSANDKTPEAVKSLWLHYPSVPVDYTMDVDDIKISTSDSRPAFFPVER